jgi:hypothetical protein
LHVFITLLERRKAIQGASVCFTLFNTEFRMDALVDSGCFLCDPLTKTPVLLLKKEALPHSWNVDFLAKQLEENWDLKKKMRLIFTHSLGQHKTLTAFLVDDVEIRTKGTQIKITLCIAIDEEGGTYGGYRALIPSSVLNYV